MTGVHGQPEAGIQQVERAHDVERHHARQTLSDAPASGQQGIPDIGRKQDFVAYLLRHVHSFMTQNGLLWLVRLLGQSDDAAPLLSGRWSMFR